MIRANGLALSTGYISDDGCKFKADADLVNRVFRYEFGKYELLEHH